MRHINMTGVIVTKHIINPEDPSEPPESFVQSMSAYNNLTHN